MQMVGSSFGHHKRSEYLRSKVGLQVVGLLRGVGVEKGLLFCFDGRCRVLFKVGAFRVYSYLLVHFTDFESLDGKISRVLNCRCGIYFIYAYSSSNRIGEFNTRQLNSYTYKREHSGVWVRLVF